MWSDSVPYGRPGEGFSVSLIIGILALGSGLTSKLVSVKLSAKASVRSCAILTPFEKVSDHRNQIRGMEGSFFVVDQADQVHV